METIIVLHALNSTFLDINSTTKKNSLGFAGRWNVNGIECSAN